MKQALNFLIDGAWVPPLRPHTRILTSPADGRPVAELSYGAAEDVNRAVGAARTAFSAFSQSPPQERLELIRRIAALYRQRYEELASAMTEEMGVPITYSRTAQAAAALGHVEQAARSLESFAFSERRGPTLIVKEAIGVCGLITPWNWPINQVVVKVMPALAAGCTMVLKPSEYAPLSAAIFARILEDADLAPGVFNLVQGEGAEVGAALAAHPDVDMVSFTGSTRAGIDVARLAAGTVKRVTQELGGKAANILLDDADLKQVVPNGVQRCFNNAGQSCAAPTRMLVPEAKLAEVIALARTAAAAVVVGDPRAESTTLGPVVNRRQFDRIQTLIRSGIAEGAELVAGGLGHPDGLENGHYVRPTIFARVTAGMRIAREEIFGPVLCILSYRSEDEAIAIANDTPYGLSAFVHSSDPQRARAVALKLRAGQVHINNPPSDLTAPFGGYKQSGNGREWAEFGMNEFLETKALLGWAS